MGIIDFWVVNEILCPALHGAVDFACGKIFIFLCVLKPDALCTSDSVMNDHIFTYTLDMHDIRYLCWTFQYHVALVPSTMIFREGVNSVQEDSIKLQLR